MQSTVEIEGKTVTVEWSEAANAALALRDRPLLAEMELYFSCLIRKKVRFGDGTDKGVAVNYHLAVSFRPVMTRICSVSESGDEGPPLTDFPIARPEAFVPHWLRIDYVDGKWQGEFGYRQGG